ncbi:radical SAM protein [Desulfomicrobium sp. ZS1]|uniref:radical SAM protein n=1 Tax=Desulfomicrobium sp. ZS1 TaxID=2952228 RepID=UPI0020B2BD66|nr:radical SAM protein [Desulfomicrobium sp. ZS1]UTF51821.1 radical SAM protein [Desulfomicrobium sp. ZS1]
MTTLNFPHDIAYVQNLARTIAPCAVKKKDHHFNLGIGLSTRCNFRCPMCYYHSETGDFVEPRDMPLSLLDAILNQLPTLANITVGLEGEPFCHPSIFQALDMMAQKSDRISIVSNGSLLTPSVCRTLSAYPITLFALSIDAADTAAYAKFRVGGNLQTFKKHGACLAEYFGDAVRLHTVMFAENLDSIFQMPQVAAEMGIGHISFQQLRPHAAALRRGITPSDHFELESCLNRLIENAKKYNIVLHFDSFFANKTIMQMLSDISETTSVVSVQPHVGKQCPYIFNFTSILSDGRIFPCCGDFRPAEVGDYSFDGIFNHDYLKSLRTLCLQSIPMAPCSLCRQDLMDY